jgi:ribosomal-protein-alanine N-acetyltransferase
MDWFKQIWEEETGIWWGICYKETPERMLGACGLNGWNKTHNLAEIGYWLLPSYQRQGIMNEAVSSMLQYAFRHMKMHRVHAIVEPENTSSVRLLEQLGFLQEGHQRDAEFKNGKYIDLLLFGLLNPDD